MARKTKKPKSAAVRRSLTAAGVAAAATVGLATQGGTAAAASPEYSDDLSAYSHSIDNVLAGAKQRTDAVNGIWGPLASNSFGLLPTFTASNHKTDITRLSEFPDFVRAIAQTPMPTGIPGVNPQINIPGQGFGTLPLPTSLPGAELLWGLADGVEAVYGIPGIDWIVGAMPPLSQLIPGLEATQENFQSGFELPILGIGGSTSVSNTFLQTPAGSPSITAEMPVAQSVYTLPFDTSMGWWGAAPTLAVSDGSASDFMVSLPMGALGVQAPGGLAQAGIFKVSAVLPSASGVYIPVEATLTNLGIPGLGFGITHLNVASGNYFGADGINFNNGQNILVIQTPLTGAIPIPIVYSLGGFNVGPNGIGYTAPSLFGISPISPIQIGTAPTGKDPVGIIPADLIPVGDILPTELISVTGLASMLLGVEDPSTTIGNGLTPPYNALITPGAQGISDLLTQEYGAMVDGLAWSSLQLSEKFKQLMDLTKPATTSAAVAPQATALSVSVESELAPGDSNAIAAVPATVSRALLPKSAEMPKGIEAPKQVESPKQEESASSTTAASSSASTAGATDSKDEGTTAETKSDAKAESKTRDHSVAKDSKRLSTDDGRRAHRAESKSTRSDTDATSKSGADKTRSGADKTHRKSERQSKMKKAADAKKASTRSESSAGSSSE